MPEKTGERPSLLRWVPRAAGGGFTSVCRSDSAALFAAACLDRVMSAPPGAAGFSAAAAASFPGGPEPATTGYPYYPSPPDGYYSLPGWGYPADMSPSEYSPPPPQPPPPGYPLIPAGQYPPEAYPGLPAGWDSAQPRPGARGVKPKRGANKKERRRTMSINNAFAELRDCIPNVPADTKLSKIKTLRLATSYISYLSSILECDDESVPEFKAEVKKTDRNDEKRKRELVSVGDPGGCLCCMCGLVPTMMPRSRFCSETVFTECL